MKLPAAPATRKTLAELNATFAHTATTPDGFTYRTEYRVGQWGVAYTHAGRSRGQGGKLRHVMVVSVITALPDGFDDLASCLQNGPKYLREYATSPHPSYREQAHGGSNHHTCHALKVGDVGRAHPVCREQNVGLTGSYEPEQADTDRVDCNNCAAGFFKESPELRAQMDAERKAALAALPKTLHCTLCDREQKRQYIKLETGECTTCDGVRGYVTMYQRFATEWAERHVNDKHDEREANYMLANPNAEPRYYRDNCLDDAAKYTAQANKALRQLDRLEAKGRKAKAARYGKPTNPAEGYS